MKVFKNHIILKVFIAFLISLWLILFAFGISNYHESKLMYSMFSLIYFILLASGFYKTISYSYIFLVIFLFLGFWFKLTIHTILKYSYVEPVGNFYLAQSSMDDVLMLSSVGAIAVLTARLLFYRLNLKSTIEILTNNSVHSIKPIYLFYKKYDRFILFFGFIFVLILAILNITLGIQMSGVVPKTMLVFPLNALVSWLLGTGFSLMIGYFLWLEIFFEKKLNFKMIVLFLIICSITSIALLSRGQYIFLFGGLVFFIVFNKDYITHFSFLNLFKIFIFGVLIYVFVIYGVTTLRGLYFNGMTIYDFSGVSGVLLGLAADRWVGLEGIMAVVSYPEKSFYLFYNALIAKSTIGSIDIYQFIANAHYKDMDNTKYAFATIPGAMAFLYYSGSYIVVFIGMIILVSLMIFMEKLVLFMSRSTLFASIIGVSLASSIAQFGLTPINVVKSLTILFCFLLCLKFLEKALSKQSE